MRSGGSGRSSREASGEPDEQRAACVLELGDLALDAALELGCRLVVEIDARENQFQAWRQVVLSAAFPASKAALIEVQCATVAVVGQEVRVVLVRRLTPGTTPAVSSTT